MHPYQVCELILASTYASLLTAARSLLALARSDLCVGHGNATQELGLVVRKLVHCSKGDVECARVGMVHCEDVDALAVVGDLPTSAASR